MTCGDGAFYKNIEARIYYVSPEELRVEKINNINYFSKLQSREQQVYLSTNPLILQGAGPKYVALLRNKEMVEAISQNQATAELLQCQVDKLAINFAKRSGAYVLMHGTLEALVLPDRTEPKKYKTPFGYHQYLLLQNKANIIRSVRLIKLSW